MSNESRSFSPSYSDHGLKERSFALGESIWHIIGWVWSSIILGGLFVNLLISYAMNGNIGDIRTWVVLRLLLEHPLVASLILILRSASRSTPTWHTAGSNRQDGRGSKRIRRRLLPSDRAFITC